MENLENKGVYMAHDLYKSSGVNHCGYLINCGGVNSSYVASFSCGLDSCHEVYLSKGLSLSFGVDKSEGVYASFGVVGCKGVNHCFGLFCCEGISDSVFCYNTSGKYLLFNKQVTSSRCHEVYNKLAEFQWFPSFAVKKESTDGQMFSVIAVHYGTAWSLMPEEMKKYLRSLPEYNEKIFNIITNN